MNRRLIPAALACACVLALAGCGNDAGPTAVAAAAPTATSAPVSTPASTPAPAPASPGVQWPATGCDARSVVSVDYGRMPQGYDSPEEAVAHTSLPDLPDGDLVLAPAQAKGPALVWVVAPGTQDVQAQVTLYRGPDGWFVDGVTTCR